MLDYHLHLLPHGEDRPLRADAVRAYARRAGERGVVEIAITEHFFRFGEGQAVVAEWWRDDPDPRLRSQTEAYFRSERLAASLDDYVAAVQEAADDPGEGAAAIKLGLEVDYYPDRMEEVSAFLGGYPFDVVLGSVHWLGAWGFDQYDDPVVAAEWQQREPGGVWSQYVDAVETLAASGVCDVLAHVDLAKVTGVHPPDGGQHVDERLVKAAAAHGVCVEVSSAGWRKPVAQAYPAPALLRSFSEAGVAITLASDAHDVATVADRVDDAAALASAAGYREVTSFTQRAARRVRLGEEG